ncbi:MAG: tRNA (adenosine(37)-N6)-dimethylallyltransferase MiaA [Melioribacteraceae bacterium]|nr:tRNA (adenosine(37)-N6)-dimethylallyltransferase MiaA [Melioribacteraceae bacterium]MCF8263659.1 tRNA (adenosine(37)-N6)-dimethylallyltransferase MiaA [Melioribacteraceae bacterium]MCF8412604.1 tRNA (adenosine(37)-N6)-dimethylallyltransferase MiaA [Melioribacteraceae bacterium]MCF8431395.1 tRNA (adenosine(37)-N6)-dimethylallyltransferase MiaA [Melioribacteraceae bacterium]
MNYNLITVLGPTACGKTTLAVRIAQRYSAEIISADSRQVYKGMDIGTGKDLHEFEIDGQKIDYHLIDVADPKSEFNLYQFRTLFYDAFEQINLRKRNAIMVGGSGLYLSSIIQNYEMIEKDLSNFDTYKNMSTEELADILLSKKTNLHNTTDLISRDRILEALTVAESKSKSKSHIDIVSLNIGVRFDRETIKKRITRRLKTRLKNGMIEEVENLINRGVSFERMKLFGLEYKFIALHLKGELNYNDMFQKLNSAIHAFAKRQMTWFRKMEREGVEINWIDGSSFEQSVDLIEKKYFKTK